MTPGAQRIAIAETCGAKIISKRFEDGIRGNRRIGKKWAWRGNEATPCSHPGGGLFGWGWNREASPGELPDYLNDLNAMHEAEKTLTGEQYAVFARHLDSMLFRGSARDIISATAAQRAEAFLKTTGKWEQPNKYET